VNRALPVLGALFALGVLLGIGLLVLGGGSSPPPPPEVVRPRAAARVAPAPEEPPPDSDAPGGDPDGPPAPPAVPEGEPEIVLRDYPFAVPAWWTEREARLREVQVDLSGEFLTVEEVLHRVGKAAGFSVKPGPEVSGFAASTPISFPSAQASARGILEALALRLNLEPVLTREGVVMHQRGKAPPGPIPQAGRVQWALVEARERREGKRPEDPDSGEARSIPVDIVFTRTPLREAVKMLTDRTTVPVYLDEPLWTANPPVTVEKGKGTLGEVLDAIAGPLDAATDATRRRVLLFRP
jgi:hypothetical protein